MSVGVALEELGRRVDELGVVPFLVTTGDGGASHVVSVRVAYDGGRFLLTTGRTSRANVTARPAVTLLWPGPSGPYALIVDGQGAVEGEELVVEPTRAVLHRQADAPADLPSCVPLDAPG